jgi:hypothetical protein
LEVIAENLNDALTSEERTIISIQKLQSQPILHCFMMENDAYICEMSGKDVSNFKFKHSLIYLLIVCFIY